MSEIQIKTFSEPTSEETRELLMEIMQDERKCELLSDAFFHQFMCDDEPPEKRGYYMAQAILADNAEDLLLALVGWSAESLVSFALNEEDSSNEEDDSFEEED